MSGETGCIPVYGTQTEIAVNTFLDNLTLVQSIFEIFLCNLSDIFKYQSTLIEISNDFNLHIVNISQKLMTKIKSTF